MLSSSTGGIVKARRNGKLASCEQCRKRKVACDHKTPSCGRCERLGIAKECYYHAAPLTRPKIPSRPRSGGHNAVSSPTSRSTTGVDESTPQQRPSHSQRSSATAPESFLRSSYSSGFAGLGSSTAVVAEINGSLGISTPELVVAPVPDTIKDSDIAKGTEVLSFLCHPELRQLMHHVFKRWYDHADGYLIYRPFYQIWLKELNRLLDHSWTGKPIRALSEKIWSNTQRPLLANVHISATEWALQVAGENIRWEVVGLMLILIGTEISELPGWHFMFQQSVCGLQSRTQIMRKVFEMGNACVAFAKQCGPRNDLLACLMYLCMLMSERAVPDSSSEAWYNMGIVCDTVIALGFHQQKKVDRGTPFFLRELRDRLFSLVYNHDKFLAEFFGRPSRISYRHCSMADLSTLSDEEICAGGEELAALSTSRPTQPNRMLWRNVFPTLIKLREDLLEITLGLNDDHNEFRNRIAQARSSLEAADKQMPSFAKVDVMQLLRDVRHAPQHMSDTGTLWTPRKVALAGFIHLTRLRLEFLLERASLNRDEVANPSGLLAASRNALVLSLRMASCKDFFVEHQIDLQDIIYFHALPPAGVLAIELLRQDRTGNNDPTFPRSEIIQNLSILIAELEAVGPEEGNYGVCVQGANALKSVLDTALTRQPQRMEDVARDSMLLDGQLEFNNDADFLSWLGQVDFEAGPWVDGT